MKRRNYLRSRSLVAIATLAVAVVVPAVRASAGTNDLSRARAGAAPYHDVNAAVAAGYGEFTDVNGIACIDNPGVGAMGIHYVNSALVGDPTENAATPEAVVYEPEPDGHLRMVAVEYIVVKSAWDSGRQHRAAVAVRPTVHVDHEPEPLRTARLLRAARLDREVQPERDVQHVEPGGQLHGRP